MHRLGMLVAGTATGLVAGLAAASPAGAGLTYTRTDSARLTVARR